VSHCEPESLTLLALGEREGLDAEVTHIAECAECAEEVATFAALVDLARSTRHSTRRHHRPAGRRR
jgi:anti-sigma factor RsiW